MNEVQSAKQKLKTARQNTDAENWGVVIKDRDSFQEHRNNYLIGWLYAGVFMLAIVGMVVVEALQEVLR